MIAVSLAGKMANVCIFPDFNHHPFGYCVIFSGKKVTAPKSEGARTPMSNSDLYKKGYIHSGILKLLMPTNTYKFLTVFLMVCLIDKKQRILEDTFSFSSTIFPRNERTIDLSLPPLS